MRYQANSWVMCGCDKSLMIVPRKNHIPGSTFSSCATCGDFDACETAHLLRMKESIALETEAMATKTSSPSTNHYGKNELAKAVATFWEKHIIPAFEAEPIEWAKYQDHLGDSPGDIVDSVNELYLKAKVKGAFLDQVRGDCKPGTWDNPKIIFKLSQLIEHDGVVP